jgi:hypothetical protein
MPNNGPFVKKTIHQLIKETQQFGYIAGIKFLISRNEPAFENLKRGV